MKKRFKFLATYLIFWIGIIIACKIFFLVFHYKQTINLDFHTIMGIFRHGARLDLSFIGYVFIFPLLVLFIASFFSGMFCYYILKVYNYMLFIILPFLFIADLVLYRFWGFRLDKTPLLYIRNPDEMFASVSTGFVLMGILFSALLSVLLIHLYNRYIGRHLKNLNKATVLERIITGVLLPFIIIPVRGGFDTSPVNLSSAYFSPHTFANHAAINLYWNLGYSFTNRETKKNPYAFYNRKSAQSSFAELMDQSVSDKTFISIRRPNIILIILESFSSKIIGTPEGLPEITPGFNRLLDQGIFFTNFFANGDRSDKGIVALFSGFPALGKTSVMKFPDKAGSLSNIARDLTDSGYHLSFYYGGDIEFFNLKSYLISAGYDDIVYGKHFGSERRLSKWGAPDEFVFNKMYDDIINATDTPFFKTMFSLSNHEPFDIPGKAKFPGKDTDNKFFSSAWYTDSCLYQFVEQVRKTAIWNKTLVILVADHGSRLPENLLADLWANYSIPMLWLGGVLQNDTIIYRFGSQTDLSKTLLNQLGMNANQYVYSQDLFLNDKRGFAMFAFNDGFGFLTDSIRYIYDHQANRISVIKGEVNKKIIKTGKSFLQLTYEDFLSR